MEELLTASALDQARAVRAGDISALELGDAAIRAGDVHRKGEGQ